MEMKRKTEVTDELMSCATTGQLESQPQPELQLQSLPWSHYRSLLRLSMLCAKLLPLEHCNSSIYQTFAQPIQ